VSNPHPDPLADMLTMPHDLDGKFEPQAKTVTTCISDAALTSIAVSMKRIADALDGAHVLSGRNKARDLVEVKPKRVMWFNVYHGGEVHAHDSREDADRNSGDNRVARLKIEFEEGQFDD